MSERLEAFIARHDYPISWTIWHWWVNFWRLLGEHVEIRVMLDVALRCPDVEIAKKARDKFGDGIHVDRLDVEWPGRGDFIYDWESLVGLANKDGGSDAQEKAPAQGD